MILFLLLSGLLGIVVKKRIEVDGRQAYIPSSFGRLTQTKLALRKLEMLKAGYVSNLSVLSYELLKGTVKD